MITKVSVFKLKNNKYRVMKKIQKLYKLYLNRSSDD